MLEYNPLKSRILVRRFGRERGRAEMSPTLATAVRGGCVVESGGGSAVGPLILNKYYILYYPIPYYTALYYPILNYPILSYPILYYTVLYYAIT